MDLESLLKPLEGDPAGPDLSYDDGRLQIESAFAISGEGARAEDVKWPAVITRIREQAEHTRDLWLAVYLARAGALAGSLDVVVEGAALLAGLLEEHWPLVHPKLDEVGFMGRKNACDSLAKNAEFIGPLRRVALLSHPRLGAFCFADLERFEQNGDAEQGFGAFRALLDQLDAEIVPETLEQLDQLIAALRRADAVLTAEAGEDTGTDFSPTYAVVHQMRHLLARAGGVSATAEEPDAQDTVEVAAAPDRASPGAAPGRVDSRDDVIRTIDSLVDYYRRREPGSPVPLALQRARAWVPMNFMQVLADIAPTNIEDAQRVLMNRAMIAATETE